MKAGTLDQFDITVSLVPMPSCDMEVTDVKPPNENKSLACRVQNSIRLLAADPALKSDP